MSFSEDNNDHDGALLNCAAKKTWRTSVRNNHVDVARARKESRRSKGKTADRPEARRADNVEENVNKQVGTALQ